MRYLAFFVRQVAYLIVVFFVSLLSFQWGWTVGFTFGSKAAIDTGRESFHASDETPSHPTLRGYCVTVDGAQKCVERAVLDALVKASVR